LKRFLPLALCHALGLCALLWTPLPAQASPLAGGDEGGGSYFARCPDASAGTDAPDDGTPGACAPDGEPLSIATTGGTISSTATAQGHLHGSHRLHGTSYRNAVLIGGHASLHGNNEGGRSFVGGDAGNHIILGDAPDLPNNTPQGGAHPDREPPPEHTKAPAEGRACAMALVSQAGDLVGGAGMARALAATDGVSGTTTFGATAEDGSRYHAGSHIDADSLNLMIGVAGRYPAVTGHWMAGVFLEGGYSSYDTYNDFSGQPSVQGSGTSSYFGGGVLLRRDWADEGQAGPYAEGSLRAGHIGSDWESNDMIGSDDASYGTSTLYVGAHLGAGYALPLDDATSLDAYAKGFWTHLNSNTVTIADAPYGFQAMDSLRTRLGLRLNHAVTEHVTAYVGAAWEHEFSGKARATAYGRDTPAPSLQGDTGVFELGFDLKPRTDGPLIMGLGLQAYTGIRQGFGGTAQLTWVF
jgi:hypothetical protein